MCVLLKLRDLNSSAICAPIAILTEMRYVRFLGRGVGSNKDTEINERCLTARYWSVLIGRRKLLKSYAIRREAETKPAGDDDAAKLSPQVTQTRLDGVVDAKTDVS